MYTYPRLFSAFLLMVFAVHWVASQPVVQTDSAAVSVDFSTITREVLSDGVLPDGMGVRLNALIGVYETPILDIPVLNGGADFIALTTLWDVENPAGVPLQYAFRWSEDGQTWETWEVLLFDEHSRDATVGLISGLHDLPRSARVIQYQVSWNRQLNDATPVLRRVTASFYDAGISPVLIADTEITRNGYPKPPVVSRTAWGNPQGQSSPNWQPTYTEVSHIFVHHTATSNGMSDWAAQVRNVWNYHTNTLGWGDIGYNYLIDPNGVIYEGRAGGDNVKAAHAGASYNTNSIGIALLGCFHPTGCPNTPTEPTAAGLDSLAELIAWKGSQRGIDPTVSSTHAHSGQYLSNVIGHGQAPSSSTVCPGNYVVSRLDAIKSAAKAKMNEQITTATPSLTPPPTHTFTLQPPTLTPTQTLTSQPPTFTPVPPTITPQPVMLSIGDASMLEGNSGQKLLTFTITLSRASNQSVQVSYITGGGTATAQQDYQDATGTLTIPAGQTSATLSVIILGDVLVEPSETFSVVLYASVGATITDADGSGTIIDDDTSANEWVSNGGFETGITGWVVRNAPSTRANDKITCTEIGASGSRCAFVFTGGVGENTRLTQTILNPMMSLNDSLYLTTAYNTKIVAPNITFKIKAFFANGTTKNVIVIPASNFRQTTTTNAPAYVIVGGWLPADITAQAVSKLQVIVTFKSPSGKLHLDNLSLHHYLAGSRIQP